MKQQVASGQRVRFHSALLPVALLSKSCEQQEASAAAYPFACCQVSIVPSRLLEQLEAKVKLCLVRVVAAEHLLGCFQCCQRALVGMILHVPMLK